MRIGLLDVDGHNFPNLPLMKLSAFHKRAGDEVELLNYFNQYDRVYKSKVFTFTKENQTAIQCDDIRSGGTGYGLSGNLPEEVEHIFPDYSLYGITNTAYGFLTRGCPRGCQFCIVSGKEGKQSRHVADLTEFWDGQKNICLLDPNILAYTRRGELLQQLADSRAVVDFSQGLDVRLVDSEVIRLLNNIRIKRIHFAWDMHDDGTIERNLKVISQLPKYNRSNVTVYILCNYNTDFDFDEYRVEACRAMGLQPYVMLYDKQNASKLHRCFQRYANNPWIFWSSNSFYDYEP